MTDISENTRKRLDALRRAYAEQLPVRAGAMEDAWKNLRSGQWSRDGLSELSRQAHGLAGSGATYGFALVSDRARQLELLLDEIIKSGSNPGDRREEEVDRLLQGLKETCLGAAVGIAPAA